MYILKRRALFSFAALYGAGVVCGYLFSPPAVAALISACVLGLAALALTIMGGKRPAAAAAGIIAFFLAVSSGGAAYVRARLDARPIIKTSYNISFSGRVTGSPYIDEDGARFVCKLTDVRVNDTAANCDVRLYLRGESADLKAIGCGQTVSGMGHLFAGNEATNPGGFDFGEYLWREGMAGYITVKQGEYTVTGTRGGFPDMLYKARRAISERIDALFPRSAEVAKGLLLGDKRNMDDDLREDFSDAGIAHLLAISGLHISLIAMAIAFALKYIVGIRAASTISFICVMVYGAVVGFSPSVLRAIIMYIVMCLAPAFGRKSEGTTRLALAFALTLIINPLYIADAGFVLSFSAAAGIIWLSGPILSLTRADRIKNDSRFPLRVLRRLCAAFSVTLAAQLATYPAVAMYYSSVPLISLAANLLIAPFAMAALISTLVGVAVPVLAFIPDAALYIMTEAVSYLADIDWNIVTVSSPPAWLWLGFLAVGLCVSEISLIKVSFKPYIVLAMPVLVILAVILAPRLGCGVTFLDVGQGDSAVIEIDGKAYVVDLGTDGSAAAGYIGEKALDATALFLSHPHTDHAGGLAEFMDECPVEIIYVPEGWFDMIENGDISSECEYAADMGAEFIELDVGEVVDLSGGARITVLDSERKSNDLNSESMIMLLDYGASQVLFTGDAYVEDAPDVEILKVGHHGSADATNAELLGAARPEIAVISVGANNSYGHPSGKVLEVLDEYGAKIYRTDECGAITVALKTDGDFTVETYLEAEQ